MEMKHEEIISLIKDIGFIRNEKNGLSPFFYKDYIFRIYDDYCVLIGSYDYFKHDNENGSGSFFPYEDMVKLLHKEFVNEMRIVKIDKILSNG